MNITNVFHLALFNASRGLGLVRWIAVPVAFLVVGWLQADYVAYDFALREPRDANLWDVPLSAVASWPIVVFAFGLGFLLIVGDLLVYDLSSGSAATTLVRSRSRLGWWVAKVLSLLPLALVYSCAAFFAMLAAGAVRLPLSIEPSPAALVPWEDKGSMYPFVEALPMPVFLLLVALYSGLALWAVGSAGLMMSAFFPRTVVVLAFNISWIAVVGWLIAPLYQRGGLGTLDPAYRLSYAVHFVGPGTEGASWVASATVMSSTLLLAVALGAWKMRGADI